MLKNINTIKTREDFEFIAIEYDWKTITEEQRNKIRAWADKLAKPYNDINFRRNDKYIRFNFDDNEEAMASFPEHYYNNKGNKDKYTIIKLSDFLCEEEASVATGNNTPQIIKDTQKDWDSFEKLIEDIKEQGRGLKRTQLDKFKKGLRQCLK